MRIFLSRNVCSKSIIAQRIRAPTNHSWEDSHDFSCPMIDGRLPRFMGASHESWEPPMNNGRLPWIMGGSHDSWEFPMIHGRFPWFIWNHGRVPMNGRESRASHETCFRWARTVAEWTFREESFVINNRGLLHKCALANIISRNSIRRMARNLDECFST